MLSGNDFASGTASALDSAVMVNLRHIPIDDTWPAAPQSITERVLDDWLPQRREHADRLQMLIDDVDSQLLLLDGDGRIALVNRAWRLAADVQQLDLPRHGLGINYLTLCHVAAAQGCRDAANAAEGIDAVLAGRWRSFQYRYAWTGHHERRLYLMRAWRYPDAAGLHVAVQHELLESHAISDAERSWHERAGVPMES
jgi:PAS domain-containing protein